VQAATSKQNNKARQDGIRYLPLDRQNDEIRVLILEPGSDQDELYCTLETYQLNNCRTFEALSYAWGDPKAVEPIFVNGSHTLIAHNVYVALRHLRYTQSSRVLWIDALCINQTDTQERNHQVFVMGRVYSTASLVLVWLGEAQGSSDFIIDRFKDLGEGKEVAAIEKTALKILVFDCLKNQAWWNRLWVVQEVVLAKSDPIIICGSRCVPWGIFIKGCDAVGFKTGVSWRTKAESKIKFQIQALSELRASRSGTLGSSLAYALSYTKDFRVTDPRDTIYGCLGLLHTSERGTMRPDYQKPTELLFLEATKSMLEHHSGSYFYTLFSVSKKIGTASRTSPSWVPDFSSQEQASFCNPSLETYKYKQPNPCCGQRSVSFQGSNKILAISGFFFDSIEVAVELKSTQALLLGQIPELDRLVQHAHNKKILPDDSRYSLSRLKRQQDLFSVLCQNSDAPKLRRQYEILAGLAELPFEKVKDSKYVASLTSRLTFLINVAFPGRCFFVTSIGFVGVAVTKVRKNDSVTFLFGERLFTILRPQGLSYTMVGAAYVSGILDGEESSDIYRKGLVKETTFLIR
jgi:hypothetical protein